MYIFKEEVRTGEHRHKSVITVISTGYFVNKLAKNNSLLNQIIWLPWNILIGKIRYLKMKFIMQVKKQL